MEKRFNLYPHWNFIKDPKPEEYVWPDQFPECNWGCYCPDGTGRVWLFSINILLYILSPSRKKHLHLETGSLDSVTSNVTLDVYSSLSKTDKEHKSMMNLLNEDKYNSVWMRESPK